jgi:hypothetical protein
VRYLGVAFGEERRIGRAGRGSRSGWDFVLCSAWGGVHLFFPQAVVAFVCLIETITKVLIDRTLTCEREYIQFQLLDL